MNSTESHHKHPPLAKPTIGEWGRNEIALLGAPCPVIKTFAGSIADTLRSRRNVTYVDADHAEANKEQDDVSALGFNATYTDKIHRRRIDIQRDPSMFERRAMLSEQDVILINGNHFKAKEQIVLLHSKKIESLQRKADRLTNVIAVLEIDVSISSCAFLDPYLRHDTKVFRSSSQAELIDWLDTRINDAPVRGLVLAGGKSVRMGTDKTVIEYHGLPQREYLLRLLDDMKIPAYLSCRPDQAESMTTEFPLVQDRFTGLGPYGAILSAMQFAPDDAWLVVATDLPMVSQEALNALLKHRNPSKVATAFHNPATGFPEPLITLWEPKAYPLLLSYLAQGNVCPRKALINSDVSIIEAKDPNWLMNVNTPEELKKATSYAKASEVEKG